MDTTRPRPAPTHDRPVFRLGPAGISGVLDAAFWLYRDAFWRCYLVVLVPNAVAYILIKLYQFGAGIEPANPLQSQGKLLLFSLVSLAVTALGSVVATGALTLAASELCLGRPARVRPALRSSLRALLRMTLARLVVLVLAGAIALVLFIPVAVGAGALLAAEALPPWLTFTLVAVAGILAWLLAVVYTLRFILAIPAMLIERRGVVGALARSRELVARLSPRGLFNPRSHILRAGVIYLVLLVLAATLYVLFSLSIGFMLGIMHAWSGEPLQVLWQQFQQGPMVFFEAFWRLVYVAVEGYAIVCLVVFYYEIRARREGFDLLERLHRLRNSESPA
jgi:hypothetical protein